MCYAREFSAIQVTNHSHYKTNQISRHMTEVNGNFLDHVIKVDMIQPTEKKSLTNIDPINC